MESSTVVEERASNAHGFRNWVNNQLVDHVTSQGRRDTAAMDVMCCTNDSYIPLDIEAGVKSCNKASTVVSVKVQTEIFSEENAPGECTANIGDGQTVNEAMVVTLDTEAEVTVEWGLVDIRDTAGHVHIYNRGDHLVAEVCIYQSCFQGVCDCVHVIAGNRSQPFHWQIIF